MITGCGLLHDRRASTSTPPAPGRHSAEGGSGSERVAAKGQLRVLPERGGSLGDGWMVGDGVTHQGGWHQGHSGVGAPVCMQKGCVGAGVCVFKREGGRKRQR